MNQDTTQESLMAAARDRGKVLRCRPNGGDVDAMDFIRIHGSVLTDRYAGLCTGEDTAHIYHSEEVEDHVRATLEAGGAVLKVNQEDTRWGEFDYGSE